LAKVEVIYEAELPFWLSMKDGEYKINIKGKIWPFYLYNDRWKVVMRNELDHSAESMILVDESQAKNIKSDFPNEPYYHKEKLKTIVRGGFGWPMVDGITVENAYKKFRNEVRWANDTFLTGINKFIELYRISNTNDRIPYVLSIFDISRSWWYSLFLNNKQIGGGVMGYDIYPTLRKRSSPIDTVIQKDIVKKLESGYSPPTEQLIFENAVGLHIRGRFRTAVIEAFTAFDLFLTTFLRLKFEQKNYDQKLIDYLISRCNNFGFILGKGMELAIGKSFNKINPRSKLWKKWQEDVSPLRNDIIHRGKDVSRKESTNVIDVLNAMINEIVKNENANKNKRI
jgi:hypothetical protein